MSALSIPHKSTPAFYFIIGASLPLLLRLSGTAWREGYDRVVVPALHRGVLPWLPAVAAAAVVLALLRAESLRTWPGAMLALGVAVSLPLVNDWWYFAPVSLAVLVLVAVWQVRLELWSRHRLAAGLASLVLGAALVRMAFDWSPHLGFDGRFGFGFPTRYEPWVRVALVGGPFLLLALWVKRLLRRGPGTRPLFGALLDAEPRALGYLRASAALTRCKFELPGGAKPRFAPLPSCAAPAPEAARLTAFPADPASLSTRGCVAAVRRAMPLTALLRPLRWLRPAATAPGHPSLLVRGMLAEAAQREMAGARQALLGDGEGHVVDRLAALTPEARQQAQALADLYFSRHVQFREALIDAHHLLFLPVAREPAGQWPAQAAAALERLKPRRASEAVPPSLVEPQLAAASRAQLALWLDALDWLYFQHGERMVAAGRELERPAVSLVELTCNLLALRQAARTALGRPDSPHAAAADLGLWLLIGAQLTAADAARKELARPLEALRQYLNDLAARPPAALKDDAAAQTEARLAGAGYALLCLALGDARDAPRAFVAENGASAEAGELAWLGRVGGFAKAAYAAVAVRSKALNVEDVCFRTLTNFKQIDEVPLDGATGAAPTEAGLRSLHFVLHLLRAEKPAAPRP